MWLPLCKSFVVSSFFLSPNSHFTKVILARFFLGNLEFFSNFLPLVTFLGLSRVSPLLDSVYLLSIIEPLAYQVMVLTSKRQLLKNIFRYLTFKTDNFISFLGKQKV